MSYFCIISYCSVLKCCQMNWKRENRENNNKKTMPTAKPSAYIRPGVTRACHVANYADGFAVGIALLPGETRSCHVAEICLRQSRRHRFPYMPMAKPSAYLRHVSSPESPAVLTAPSVAVRRKTTPTAKLCRRLSHGRRHMLLCRRLYYADGLTHLR